MKCLAKTFNPYGAIKESLIKQALILDFNFEKNRFGLLFLEGQNGYIFGKRNIRKRIKYIFLNFKNTWN